MKTTNEPESPWRALHWIYCALGVAYACLLPRFYALTNAETRFTFKWGWSNYGAILLAVSILGGIFWIAAVLPSLWMRKAGLESARRFVHVGYGLLACMVFTRCVVDIAHDSVGLSAMSPGGIFENVGGRGVLLGLPSLLFLVLMRRRFLAFARTLCILFFLMFLVFCAVGLTYPRYEQYGEWPALPEATGDRARGGANVFILFFDEWSYERTYPEGELRGDLPNLAKFSNEADTYSRHFSAGPTTLPSLSRFLLQRDASFLSKDYRALLRALRANRRPAGPSIFTGHSSHFRAAFGMHLDYPLILGADMDYVATVPYMDSAATLAQRTTELLVSQLIWMRHLGVPVQLLTQRGRGGGVNILQMQISLSRKLAQRTSVEPVYAFCHFLLPHPPYAWDSGGMRVGQMDFRSTGDAYLGNMRYMDSVLGDFIELLKEAKTYDNTLLIVTSDHSWRSDPAVWSDVPGDEDYEREDPLVESRMKHVPLLVKRPHQAAPRQIHDALPALQLYETIIRQEIE